MKDESGRLSADAKARIVIESFDPSVTVAQLCRKHGIVPRTLYIWREKLMAAGIPGLAGTQKTDSAVKKLRRENETLKRLLGESDLVIAAFKKTLGEGTG